MNWVNKIARKFWNFLSLVGQARYERDRMYMKALQDHKLGR